MDFLNKIIKKTVIPLAVTSLSTLLIVGCSKSNDGDRGGGGGGGTPTSNKSASYSGSDMRDEFLARYARSNYQVGDHHGTVEGLPKGKERLSINSDGSYFLIVSDLEVKKPDSDVVTKCTINERGMITQVRKFEGDSNVQVDDKTISGAGLAGVIVLTPGNTEVVKAESSVPNQPPATGAEQTSAVQMNPKLEDLALSLTQQPAQKQQAPEQKQLEPIPTEVPHISTEEAQTLCTNTKPRTLFVEAFLDSSFVLSPARLEGEPQKESGFFLKERLVARDGVEWIWLSGDLAKQAVVQSAQSIRSGAQGLQFEGDTVRKLEASPNDKNVTANVTMEEGANVNMEIGTIAVGQFLPVVQLAGNLMGVSYNPGSGEVVYNLVDYRIAPVSLLLQDFGMNLDIERTLRDAQRDMAPHIRKLEASAAAGSKILTVSVNASKNDRVKIRTKDRPMTVEEATGGKISF